MAIAFSEVVRIGGTSNRKIVCGKFTFDSTYLTGGETFTAADLAGSGINRLDGIVASNATPAAGGTQVAVAPINAGSGSWKLAAAGDRAVAANSPLSETTSNADLSTYIGYFYGWGV